MAAAEWQDAWVRLTQDWQNAVEQETEKGERYPIMEYSGERHIVGPQLIAPRDVSRGDRQVRVRQRHALGTARAAAGVQDQRDVVDARGRCISAALDARDTNRSARIHVDGEDSDAITGGAARLVRALARKHKDVRVRVLDVAALSIALGVQPAPGSSKAATAPAGSPAEILFVGDLPGSGEEPVSSLFVMNPDGSGKRRLPGPRALVFDPAWMPGRRRIVFAALARAKDRKTDIYAMDADGSHRVRLTNSAAGTIAGMPSPSPDGRRIAFSILQWDSRHPDTSNPEIWVMDADGKNRKRLGAGMLPAWSPDGRRILYSTGPGLKAGSGGRSVVDLAVMDPDGRNVKRLVREATEGAWSPDGRQILYEGKSGSYWEPFSPEEFSYPDLFVVDADGSNRRQITHRTDRGETSEMGLVWPPGGAHVLFTLVNSFGLTEGIYSIGLDGKDRRQLAEHAFTRGFMGTYLVLGWFAYTEPHEQ